MESNGQTQSDAKMKFNPNDPKHWKDFDPFAKAEGYVDGKSEASIARARANTINKKGKKDSDEIRKKKSESKIGRKKPEHAAILSGRKRPDYAKKMKGRQAGALNPSSKAYIITEPNGKKYEIKSLKTFAENLGKPVVTAREMATGKYPNNTAIRGAWAGWKIIEK